MEAAQQITVLTGAGISTDSGIPDFRGPDGVWTRDPEAEAMVTLQSYVADPVVRERAWRERAGHPAWTAEPNAAHRALIALERAGRLRAIVTQNVDRLHQRAGSDPDRVIEIHGTIFEVECLGCGARGPMSETLRRVEAGETDPPCRGCGGILKSATISFGQAMPPDRMRAALELALSSDLFLVLGSSLVVHPAASLPSLAKENGARLAIINREPTPLDDQADIVIAGEIGPILSKIANDL
jgi:NAD-dependent deacetylase